jgi:hypothetical protein
MNGATKWLGMMACAGLLAMPGASASETCTTQSQMSAAELNALAAAATAMATAIQSGDDAALKNVTIAEFQKNFSGIAAAVASTAPRLKGAVPEVDGVYLLDASTLQATNGVNPDAQFYCTLHTASSSPAEVEFSIPQLPPGKYSFATVRMVVVPVAAGCGQMAAGGALPEADDGGGPRRDVVLETGADARSTEAAVECVALPARGADAGASGEFRFEHTSR